MVIKHHFVLVHGLMHGAWCWYKTVDLLRRTGHRVTTLDLASCGTHPADPNTISKFTVYNQPLVDLLLLLPETEKILLVGHSMAGFSVLDTMERFHRILKVYISAVLLPSGHNLPTLQASKILFLISIVLHVAGGQDVVLGEMLSRPYPAGAMMTAAITYTNEKHGTVPSVYIKCLQDKVIVPEVQEFLIELNQISQIVEMESDHSPMLSAPEKFHQILLATSDKYA
ncbi:unnamed protein product [Sphagnum troendelagicum]|uniref:AB hydrolase-1 domain-containing protein n=1 Tax=Sphagnum troendelagicum TaxID=128251 RepID=A0ABP0USM4_9BRYO